MVVDLEGFDLFGDSPDRPVFDLWRSLLAQLFDDALLERKGELRERKAFKAAKGWEQRLVLWGGVLACERLLPELIHADASLGAVRAEAEREAWDWFAKKNQLGQVLAS